MTGLTVSTHDEGGCAVLVVSGEIDCGTVDVLRDEMRKLCLRGRVRLVIDMTDVPFSDSSGLGVMVGGFKRTRACGGSFRLAGVAPHLMKTLTITGLTKVFSVHADVAAAIAADNADAAIRGVS
jgi:anti-sigma B factor antagonist